MTATPLLEIRRITKSIGGRRILDDVSLFLERGDLKVLIGPSGAGKSTLLQCINVLIPPDDGEIFLSGVSIDFHHKRPLSAYRQRVGMIFQDFNLFDHLTALDNVMVALRKVRKFSREQARERAMSELERVGVGDKARLYPAELSGGQKQRVSIARALAMDPAVMLLDEPTSALDPELIGEVLAVIRGLATSGMTMLMATHQIGLIRSLASEVMFMENGRIVESGRPDDLLAEGRDSRTRMFCDKLDELNQ